VRTVSKKAEQKSLKTCSLSKMEEGIKLGPWKSVAAKEMRVTREAKCFASEQ
jgi:hypothetical protein